MDEDNTLAENGVYNSYSSVREVGNILFVIVIELVAISIESILARETSAIPATWSLIACGALRCFAWAIAVALAVRFLGRTVSVSPRSQTKALVAFVCVALAVIVGGIGMGLIDAWAASEARSSSAFATWDQLRTASLLIECLLMIVRWAVGSVALLSVLGASPLRKCRSAKN